MNQNEILSHHDMCGREGLSLQRGMNYRAHPLHSIVLSSHRSGAPYDDRLEESGTVLIYEGHDEPKSAACQNPKLVDQPLTTRFGKLTQNGLFHEAAQAFVRNEAAASRVRVYEKIKVGIWSYNGLFSLIDSWTETANGRRVFKFKLRALENSEDSEIGDMRDHAQQQSRLIPTAIKLEVWKRDKGACVVCASTRNLHFDHILPYSKGGTSESADNIQLLCMRHNIQKGARLI